MAPAPTPAVKVSDKCSSVSSNRRKSKSAQLNQTGSPKRSFSELKVASLTDRELFEPVIVSGRTEREVKHEGGTYISHKLNTNALTRQPCDFYQSSGI